MRKDGECTCYMGAPGRHECRLLCPWHCPGYTVLFPGSARRNQQLQGPGSRCPSPGSPASCQPLPTASPTPERQVPSAFQLELQGECPHPHAHLLCTGISPRACLGGAGDGSFHGNADFPFRTHHTLSWAWRGASPPWLERVLSPPPQPLPSPPCSLKRQGGLGEVKHGTLRTHTGC